MVKFYFTIDILGNLKMETLRLDTGQRQIKTVNVHGILEEVE